MQQATRTGQTTQLLCPPSAAQRHHECAHALQRWATPAEQGLPGWRQQLARGAWKSLFRQQQLHAQSLVAYLPGPTRTASNYCGELGGCAWGRARAQADQLTKMLWRHPHVVSETPRLQALPIKMDGPSLSPAPPRGQLRRLNWLRHPRENESDELHAERARPPSIRERQESIGKREQEGRAASSQGAANANGQECGRLRVQVEESKRAERGRQLPPRARWRFFPPQLRPVARQLQRTCGGGAARRWPTRARFRE